MGELFLSFLGLFLGRKLDPESSLVLAWEPIVGDKDVRSIPLNDGHLQVYDWLNLIQPPYTASLAISLALIPS